MLQLRVTSRQPGKACEPARSSRACAAPAAGGNRIAESVGRLLFIKLLDDADVIVHGYRPGALDGLGLDSWPRQQVRPGLIDLNLDAYGWTGPSRGRRSFDSLVQMSTRIAEAGMRELKRDKPTPLPVQALDHGTGYLMAYAVINALFACGG